MKPELHIIAAVARGGAIGRGGDLLFHISADLRRFKALTMGCPIIMGRKTFESFPRGPLPGRRNIVVTRQTDYPAQGISTAGSLQQALEIAADAEKVYVIGGGEIYRQAFDMADVLDITEIHADAPDADTFFPPIDPNRWELTESTAPEEPTSPMVNFVTYRQINLLKSK
jgi:dihydrofolate reductase